MKDIIERLTEHDAIFKSKYLKNRKERNMLNEAVSQGKVLKIKNGMYCLYDYLYELCYDINEVVPKGVLCMWSAWYHYDLCDIIPHNINIAIPQGTKVMLNNEEIPYKIYYRLNDMYSLGIVSDTRHGCTFNVYDMERCVCDAFKYRNKIGINMTEEIYESFLKKPDKDFEKFIYYAKKMKLFNVIQKYTQNYYGRNLDEIIRFVEETNC